LADPVTRLHAEEEIARKLNELAARLDDGIRPVTLDHRIDSVNIHRFLELAGLMPDIDRWVLYPPDSSDLGELSAILDRHAVSYYWEGARPALLCEKKGFMPWQDRMQRELVSFNGLIDISGYKKSLYREVEACIGQGTGETVPDWDFILPAIPTWPGLKLPVRVVQYLDDYPVINTNTGEWTIEWYLVRKNVFGAAENMMKVGEGPELYLEVPWNPEYFDVRMVVHNGEYSRHVTHPLILPVHPSQARRYSEEEINQ
jgi:hypothetical protein